MEDILKLFEDVNGLKHTEREGWKDIGVERPRDTIASHSFGASIIGWIMAEKEGKDSEKVIKTLIIHDLIMAYIEDYTPEDEEYSSKREMENRAADKLLSDVPEIIRDEFEELFKEFQEEETEFAKFCRECDKTETLLQAYIYSKQLGENHLQKFIESYKETFKTETGKETLENLRKKSSELE